MTMRVQERWTPKTKQNVARHRPRRQIEDHCNVDVDGQLLFATKYIFRLRRQHQVLVRELSMMERVASGNVSGGLA